MRVAPARSDRYFFMFILLEDMVNMRSKEMRLGESGNFGQA
jgi:hypothetical protein